MATTSKLCPKPSEPGHNAVMDDVEVGEMTELLTSQEEDTVKHVRKLGQEEVVADGEGRHGFFITAVINRLEIFK